MTTEQLLKNLLKIYILLAKYLITDFEINFFLSTCRRAATAYNQYNLNNFVKLVIISIALRRCAQLLNTVIFVSITYLAWSFIFLSSTVKQFAY